MAASVATVRRIAPELAAVSSGDLDGFLADAAGELNEGFWGPLYDRAHALAAAHLASVARPDLALAAGPVASESVGSVSRSYAVPQASTSRWSASRHGVEYLRLLRAQGPGARAI